MDTERLGRVLGVGARHAAKTLVGAVDAATAPHPKAEARPTAGPTPVPPPATAARSAAPGFTRPVAEAGGLPQYAAASELPGSERSTPVRDLPAERPQVPVASRTGASSPAGNGSRRGLVEGGRRFGRAVWEPAARLSGVLWLEVTGLFFGIFVFVAASAVWRLRGAAHLAPGAANAQAHSELLLAIGMVLLFGYFTASSFLAASRRSRRR